MNTLQFCPINYLTCMPSEDAVSAANREEPYQPSSSNSQSDMNLHCLWHNHLFEKGEIIIEALYVLIQSAL